MKIEDIKQWIVSADKLARPVNPYEENSPKGNFSIVKHKEIKLYTRFKSETQQHTFATDLEPGIYDGDKVKLQRLCMYSWNKPNYKPVSEEWYQDMKGSTENVFKTELQLLQGVEVLKNDQWITAMVTQSEIDEFKEVNRWFRMLPFVQPLNPNANAIKVIEGMIAELQPYKESKYARNKIDALEKAIKLLKS